MNSKFQPKDLEDAINHILNIICNDQQGVDILEMNRNDENGFISQLHNSYGRSLRNDWFLWWYENHDYTEHWPKDIPPIVQYFNNLKIYHADDMSSIILKSIYRHFFNIPLDIEEQIKVYHKHWLKYAGNIDPRVKSE